MLEPESSAPTPSFAAANITANGLSDICQICGKSLKPNTVCCTYCASPISEKKRAGPDLGGNKHSTARFCSACGVARPNGARYCPACGEQFQE